MAEKASKRLEYGQCAINHELFNCPYDLGRQVNEYGQALLTHNTHPALQASIKRSAFVACRIAGILTVLERHEQGARLEEAKSVEVSPAALQAGLLVAQTFLAGAYELASILPGTSKVKYTTRKQGFLDALPERFSTKEAKATGEQCAIPPRTITDYLKDFVEDGLLERLAHGQYSKKARAALSAFPAFSALSIDPGGMDE